MSSAYKRILLEIQSGMSLTKQKNNKGPETVVTVPCGTPEVTGRDSLEQPSRIIASYLLGPV